MSLLQSTSLVTLPYFKFGHLWVSPMVVSSLQHQLLFHVSCRWWGKHHGPPSTSLFMSTSTHHWRIRFKKASQEPWILHASMTGFLAFDGRISSLASSWKISLIVLLQLIHSHLEECTEVTLESFTLMVISISLVNGLHQWLVIKWFLPC